MGLKNLAAEFPGDARPGAGVFLMLVDYDHARGD